MPKKLKFFLCVCLLFATIATPVAGYLYDNPLSFTNSTAANYEADKLNSLGLFLGTSSGYDLWRVSTRAEGLVMLIRLMGEEAKAKECAYTHPFQDVPAWADRYVAWAYAKGYTKGTSATTFTPNSNISSGEYITFMLRALGYGDGATPQNAVARAVEVGLIHEGMYTLNLPFWRADMVRVSYLAMTTIENTTKKPLFEVLIDRGAVDAEKARTLFQPLPQKLYSITGLRNHRLNIEASISGDNIVISGTHAMDDLVSIVILIQETPDTDTYWYKQTVLYDEIVWPDNSFRLYAPIPNP